MSATNPPPAETAMTVLLRHAWNTFGVAMRKALCDAGFDDIPRNGLYVIGGLANGAGGAPLGQLVKELRVTEQAAAQLVDTLVLRGYLDRAPNPQDRSKLAVTLTERGKAAAAAQGAALQKIDAELIVRVGEEDVSRTRRTLAVLVDMVHLFE